jgi:ParE toxin of type II toxin-antitoxin system, parDE
VSVRFTPTGRAQFLAAITYSRHANPRAAAHFRQQAEEALRRLEQFPESGRWSRNFLNCPIERSLWLPTASFTASRRRPYGWSQSGMGRNCRQSHRNEGAPGAVQERVVPWECESSGRASRTRRCSGRATNRAPLSCCVDMICIAKRLCQKDL